MQTFFLILFAGAFLITLRAYKREQTKRAYAMHAVYQYNAVMKRLLPQLDNKLMTKQLGEELYRIAATVEKYRE